MNYHLKWGQVRSLPIVCTDHLQRSCSLQHRGKSRTGSMPIPRHGPSSWGSKHHGSKTTTNGSTWPTRHGCFPKKLKPSWCGGKRWSAWKPACQLVLPIRSVGPSSSLDPWTIPSSRSTTKELPFWRSFTMGLADWDESKVEWSTSESSAKTANPISCFCAALANANRLRLPVNIGETRHENGTDPNHGHIVCTMDMEDEPLPLWKDICKAISKAISAHHIFKLRHSWQQSSDELKA